ncbi:hypothetical protein [Xylophilus sp.]|uniref:hypothetical protein n=1 Tax=Xylophilus sp. TaxID=2653893 RepID=UPI0013B82BCC|nr:hypothetical protein [Xylophilus sp.]KAF1049573.1 MAG: hypothetical protein GAK38_00672 [Xylophilus sp.]
MAHDLRDHAGGRLRPHTPTFMVLWRLNEGRSRDIPLACEDGCQGLIAFSVSLHIRGETPVSNPSEHAFMVFPRTPYSPCGLAALAAATTLFSCLPAAAQSGSAAPQASPPPQAQALYD